MVGAGCDVAVQLAVPGKNRSSIEKDIPEGTFRCIRTIRVGCISVAMNALYSCVNVCKLKQQPFILRSFEIPKKGFEHLKMNFSRIRHKFAQLVDDKGDVWTCPAGQKVG